MSVVGLSFGVSLGGAASAEQVSDRACWAEDAGFDVLTVADHLGHVAPFQQLAVAAAATRRVRLRSYVLDAYFWNPALLARETATLDVLSGGRFELGLGAGHMRHEHEDAGLPFPPIAERVRRMSDLLDGVRRRLADPDHVPTPVQHPVPVVIGCWGPAGLQVAARSAEIIGLTGLLQLPGEHAGTFRVASADETAQKVTQLRALPREADHEPVLDALLQQVVLRPDPAAAAAEFAAGSAITPEQLLASPFFLYADSAPAAARELLRRQEMYGISSWCTHPPSGVALADVITALRRT